MSTLNNHLQTPSNPPAQHSVSPDAILAEQIKKELDFAKDKAKQSLEHYRKAGELLAIQKKITLHGEWLTWLENNLVNLKRKQADAYMEVATNWEKIKHADSLRHAMKILKPSKVSESGSALPLSREDKELSTIAIVDSKPKTDKPPSLQPKAKAPTTTESKQPVPPDTPSSKELEQPSKSPESFVTKDVDKTEDNKPTPKEQSKQQFKIDPVEMVDTLNQHFISMKIPEQQSKKILSIISCWPKLLQSTEDTKGPLEIHYKKVVKLLLAIGYIKEDIEFWYAEETLVDQLEYLDRVTGEQYKASQLLIDSILQARQQGRQVKVIY